MTLHQLECSLPSDLATPLSSVLEEEALSISWDEKPTEMCHFQVICHPPSEGALKAHLKNFFQEKNLPIPHVNSSPLPAKNWVAAVHQSFPPLKIAKFYIYGSHHTETPPPQLIPLKIDAATAFGSGQHESTEGCLQALSLLSNQHAFKSPLDMGCGSGILALAMASLWHVPVLACDNDPEAGRVTLENAALNNLAPLITVEVSEGFQNIRAKTFDLIVANILATPLCKMAGEAENVLALGGFIILSGLLSWQAEDVISAYKKQGLFLSYTLPIGEWSTLIMRKQSHG